jgi:hypothetical protein
LAHIAQFNTALAELKDRRLIVLLWLQRKFAKTCCCCCLCVGVLSDLLT